MKNRKLSPGKRLVRRVLLVLFWVLVVPQVVYFGTVTVLAITYNFINPPISTLMVLRAFQGTKVRPMQFLPYKQIPSFARYGVLDLEDHNFWTHHGIVFGALEEAYYANKRAGYAAYGGSTITMQLARTLFLVPTKNYLRKYLELGDALILEVVLRKERILELYLNSIEWGPGIFGIEAGARYHFKTSVRKLDQEEISRLEAIITNPLRYGVENFYENRGMEARYEALLNL